MALTKIAADFDRGLVWSWVFGADGNGYWWVSTQRWSGFDRGCVRLEDNDIADFGASFGGKAPRHRHHFHSRFQKLWYWGHAISFLLNFSLSLSLSLSLFNEFLEALIHFRIYRNPKNPRKLDFESWGFWIFWVSFVFLFQWCLFAIKMSENILLFWYA